MRTAEARINQWTTTLRPGLPIGFDGEQFTVEEIEGRRILLRQAALAGPPKLRQVDISILLAHPTTEILAPVPEETTASAALLSGLAAEEDDELTVKVQHLQEVLTGYRLGDAALALDGEPRADFAPGKPLMHRYAVKAAELAGCSPGIVRYSLKEAGIPLRPRRAAGELARSVNRTWLRNEYHVKGRMAADIGRELNTGGNSITNLLDAWGIPRHPLRGHVPPPRVHSNPFADLPVRLSLAMPRISIRQNCLTALRSAALVPGYSTRRSAALTLGIPRTTFNAHLRLVEDTAGFAVFNHRKRPVRVTPRGQPLIREAKRRIALLDELREPHQEGCAGRSGGDAELLAGPVDELAHGRLAPSGGQGRVELADVVLGPAQRAASQQPPMPGQRQPEEARPRTPPYAGRGPRPQPAHPEPAQTVKKLVIEAGKQAARPVQWREGSRPGSGRSGVKRMYSRFVALRIRPAGRAIRKAADGPELPVR